MHKDFVQDPIDSNYLILLTGYSPDDLIELQYLEGSQAESLNLCVDIS